MRDLRTIAAACEKDLTSIGIKIGYIDGYEVNSRATGRLGQCREPSVAEAVISAFRLPLRS